MSNKKELTYRPVPPQVPGNTKTSEKTQLAVDADNNAISLSPKKKGLPTRFKRTLKTPAIKSFHGELVNVKRGPPRGAIYDFDVEPDQETCFNVSYLDFNMYLYSSSLDLTLL